MFVLLPNRWLVYPMNRLFAQWIVWLPDLLFAQLIAQSPLLCSEDRPCEILSTGLARHVQSAKKITWWQEQSFLFITKYNNIDDYDERWGRRWWWWYIPSQRCIHVLIHCSCNSNRPIWIGTKEERVPDGLMFYRFRCPYRQFQNTLKWMLDGSDFWTNIQPCKIRLQFLLPTKPVPIRNKNLFWHNRSCSIHWLEHPKYLLLQLKSENVHCLNSHKIRRVLEFSWM